MTDARGDGRRPEVLAPAGDRACLEAAVAAGADAVYFGLGGFNARARATNFDDQELAATIAYLHRHGVKGYVALNTLVFERELPEVEAAVRRCAQAGVDAVIVQDLGVARLCRAVAPALPIHASTQMTCTDGGAVELARSLGARRIVLARELSLADITAIRAETDAELEVFVHGALCIAYSGQCLTSEAIGGRSANRGACAQACRLPYELLVDGQVRDLGDKAYLLSPEDLEATALVPELVRLGVASLKIEGRLKGPEYVATTTRLYRQAVAAALGEAPGPDRHTREVALQTYSRGSGPGFLAGIDHQRLVDGATCEHRGLAVGSVEGLRRHRGRAHLVVRLEREVARGDGVVVAGGREGRGEVGGRIWSLLRPGGGRLEEVERAAAGEAAWIWLGPDVEVDVGGDLGEAGAAPVKGRRAARAGGATPTAGAARRRADASAGRSVRGAEAVGGAWPRTLYRTSDPSIAREVEALLRHPATVAIDLRLSGRAGEPLAIAATSARGRQARVESDTPLLPVSGPGEALEEATARAQLGRLGGTPFHLGHLVLDLPAHLGLPPSALNRARRALVAALQAVRPIDWPTTTLDHRAVAAELGPAADRPPPPGGLFVLCRNLDQARAALGAGADGVYLDILELTGTGGAFRTLASDGGSAPAPFVGVAPPRVRKPGEEKIDRYLRGLTPAALLVRGLGALHELKGHRDRGWLAIGDFSLNVTNRLAAAEVLGRGLDAFTPAFDLDAGQLRDLLGPELAPRAEVVLHHPMPLFHMEHCLFAALLSSGHDHRDCGRPCERHQLGLRDRAGLEHPVEADVGCRNTVFHAAAQSAAELVPALQRQGVRRFRIELVRERPADVTRLVAAYRSLLAGERQAQVLWRELRAAEGYGVGRAVVRGSLRVVP